MRHFAICAIGIALTAATASAGIVYGFSNITNNAPSPIDVASQLKMTVTDDGGGKVSFKFQNEVGIASTVEQVFFDFDDTQSSLLKVAPAPTVTNTDGGGVGQAVTFTGTVGSATLPGGNGAPYNFDTDYYASADSPAPKKGLNEALDALTVTFDLSSGRAFTDVTDWLDSGLLRVGMHVISIGTASKSDSFLNTPQTNGIVPVPSAVVLAGSGVLAIMCLWRWRAA